MDSAIEQKKEKRNFFDPSYLSTFPSSEKSSVLTMVNTSCASDNRREWTSFSVPGQWQCSIYVFVLSPSWSSRWIFAIWSTKQNETCACISFQSVNNVDNRSISSEFRLSPSHSLWLMAGRFKRHTQIEDLLGRWFVSECSDSRESCLQSSPISRCEKMSLLTKDKPIGRVSFSEWNSSLCYLHLASCRSSPLILRKRRIIFLSLSRTNRFKEWKWLLTPLTISTDVIEWNDPKHWWCREELKLLFVD